MPVGRETRGDSNGPAVVGNVLVEETAFDSASSQLPLVCERPAGFDASLAHLERQRRLLQRDADGDGGADGGGPSIRDATRSLAAGSQAPMLAASQEGDEPVLSEITADRPAQP